jgi:hypothetical protein
MRTNPLRQRGLIAEAGQPAVGSQQIDMYGINHQPINPDGFPPGTSGHLLLRQFSESVAVAASHSGGNGHRALGIGVVGCDEDSLGGLNGQDSVAGAEV